MLADNYTLEDLKYLQEAIASGELSVTHNGRKVTYRDLDEMLLLEKKIKASIQQQLNGKTPKRTFTICVDSGL